MKTDRKLLQELYDAAKAALEEAESCPDNCCPAEDEETQCEAADVLASVATEAKAALEAPIFREVEARLFGWSRSRERRDGQGASGRVVGVGR